MRADYEVRCRSCCEPVLVLEEGDSAQACDGRKVKCGACGLSGELVYEEDADEHGTYAMLWMKRERDEVEFEVDDMFDCPVHARGGTGACNYCER